MTEHPSVTTAKKALVNAMESLSALLTVVDSMETTAKRHAERERELDSELKGLRRRFDDAEQRALLYEQRSDALAEKAERNDRLEEAAEKLLVALDRLPVTMEDAGVIPGATKPAIPLYGTYDWQAVMNAKFGLQKAVRQGE